jgi:hypothetical protein
MIVLLATPSASPDCLAVLRGLLALPGVRVGLIGHMHATDLPEDVRTRLAGHFRVDHVADTAQLLAAVQAFQRSLGRVDRLIGFAEVLQIQLAKVRELAGVPGMGVEVARNFRDKNRMKEILREAGLPVARQARVRSFGEAVTFATSVGWPVVVKPLSGVGSQGTWRCADAGELAAAISALHTRDDNPAQVEAFVRGQERTFETVLIDGKPVWASQTWYLNRPLEILENPWMQWTVLFPREPLDGPASHFLPLNVEALRALGLRTGIAHMEWFIQADETPVISEVGARPPGASFMRMLGYAYDADLWARWAELEVLGTWTPLPPRRYAVGCAFFRGQGQGRRITAVHGLERAQKLVGEHVIESRLPVIGATARASYEGDGFAVVRHEDTAVVFDALRTLISNVRVELG